MNTKHTGSVSKIKESQVTIEINEETIVIPKNLLPENCSEGDTVTISFQKNHEGSQAFAKQILNEILNTTNYGTSR